MNGGLSPRRSAHRAPLLTFFGTTPNIGTTVTAFAAACRVAQYSGLSVGYLDLNLKSAKLHRFVGVDRPTATLDALRPELRTGTLTPDKLARSMYVSGAVPGLHMLFGNLLRDQAEFYAMEEIEHLLEAAEAAFDIVIADAGAYWDNAAILCALRRADRRLMATTGALSHFQEDGQRWVKQLSALYGIGIHDYEAIVIHQPWGKGGFQVKEICKEMGVALLGEMALSQPMLSQLDRGTLDEWMMRSEQGKEAMKEPAQRMIAAYGLKRPAKLVVQPWYKKLLTHRGGVSS
ncbi:hypothetical protein A8990_112104 [Paenibacillus taihuensis]|uniref:Cellulose biosynthesis protein BcsQ n=1 Tax=Paenibacillus taihuensis TaxID=1156355 RepID=A0A3D9RZ77_9BACL|nr:hypothetical protein [Paenibacillus taihuensis]REE85375.1 hypothetical protein A8990_112104 [Paenibacillus taihuensis]